MRYLLLGACLVVLFVGDGNGQTKPSPCPTAFRYLPNTSRDKNRWYGELTVVSDVDIIDGVFLAMLFDGPSLQLASSFGKEIIKRTVTEYLVRNLGYELKANKPLKVQFYVNYEENQEPPNFVGFRLNAVPWCPEKTNPPTTESSYITSPPELNYNFSETPNVAPQKPGQNLNLEELAQLLQSLGIDVQQLNSPQGQGQFSTNNFRQPVNTNNNNQYSYNRPNNNYPSNPYFGNPQSFDVRGSFPNRQQVYHLNARSVDSRLIKREKFDDFQCGRDSFSLDDNDGLALPGEFPWHVSIQTNSSHLCSGTLITAEHVLTTARCLNQFRNARQLKAFLGLTQVGDKNEYTQERGVKTIKIHPDYCQSCEDKHKNDIAVISLASPADLNAAAMPACLWSQKGDEDLLFNKTGAVSGYSKGPAQNLLKTQMFVSSQVECLLKNYDYRQILNEQNYCASLKGGAKTCPGDSGGGMVFKKKLSLDDFVWELRGILSVPFKNEQYCSAGNHVVFTDVAKHVTWIIDEINGFKSVNTL